MLKQHWAVVESRVEPTAGTLLIYLDCPALAQSAGPGQFVMLGAGRYQDPYMRYPVPIHRITRNGIALLVSQAEAPPLLAGIEVGDKLDLLGPAGKAPEVTGIQSLALIAQGEGIGPLLSLADKAFGRIMLLARVASPGQVYPSALIPRHVEYRPFIGEAAHSAWLEALAELPGWAQVSFAAGREALYTLLVKLYSQQALHWRSGLLYAWTPGDMACGTGACRGCAIPTRHGQRLRCQDGPFMDMYELYYQGW